MKTVLITGCSSGYGLETARVPIVDSSTPIAGDPDGIVEYQNLVIATKAMPRPDWVRTRVYAWISELLFFKPGLVRIPLLMLHAQGGIGFRALFEAFMSPDSRLRTLDWAWRFLEQKAQFMQQGEPEYCQGPGPDERPEDHRRCSQPGLDRCCRVGPDGVDPPSPAEPGESPMQEEHQTSPSA